MTLWALGMLRLAGWTALHSLWLVGAVVLAAGAALRIVAEDRPRLRAGITVAAALAAAGLVALTGARLTADWAAHTACWEGAASAASPGPGCAQHGVPEAEAPGAAAAPTPALDVVRRITPAAGLLGALWLAWLLVQLGRAGAAARRLRGLRRRLTPVGDRRVDALLPALCRRVGMPASRASGASRVSVRASAEVATPCLLPGWRPVVVLPTGVARHLTTPELRAVLAHELAHVARRDGLTWPPLALALCALPPSPFVGRLRRWLAEEREAACDRLALDATGAPVGEYLRALLGLERFRAVGGARPLPLASHGDGPLARRVERLARYGPRRASGRLAVGDAGAHRGGTLAPVTTVATLAALLALTLAVALPRAEAAASWAVMSHDVAARTAVHAPDPD